MEKKKKSKDTVSSITVNIIKPKKETCFFNIVLNKTEHARAKFLAAQENMTLNEYLNYAIKSMNDKLWSDYSN